MSEFTLLETVVYHRMLWAEVTEKGLIYKASAWFWGEQELDAFELCSECFPCEYAEGNCDKCIFDFKPDCYSIGSHYQRWTNAYYEKTRKKYAALIRDIPLKPKYAAMLGEL